mmetsp:Transcript_64656/g.154351  ORF Transcript_64656/g.154351 Transcript_64656/m.154351 type:complete len:379 (-) Transcript_64656:2659-3795(-)
MYRAALHAPHTHHDPPSAPRSRPRRRRGRHDHPAPPVGAPHGAGLRVRVPPGRGPGGRIAAARIVPGGWLRRGRARGVLGGACVPTALPIRSVFDPRDVRIRGGVRGGHCALRRHTRDGAGDESDGRTPRPAPRCPSLRCRGPRGPDRLHHSARIKHKGSPRVVPVLSAGARSVPSGRVRPWRHARDSHGGWMGCRVRARVRGVGWDHVRGGRGRGLVRERSRVNVQLFAGHARGANQPLCKTRRRRVPSVPEEWRGVLILRLYLLRPTRGLLALPPARDNRRARLGRRARCGDRAGRRAASPILRGRPPSVVRRVGVRGCGGALRGAVLPECSGGGGGVAVCAKGHCAADRAYQTAIRGIRRATPWRGGWENVRPRG